MQNLSLEVSEHTHERQNLICVGTALLRGQDLPSLGNIYIFAVIPVVPEPEHLETGHALKLIAKEEVKGAVTSICGIGTQGFLLVAQGQKCLVRGLKEDGSLLPVAFLDMQCYVSVVRVWEVWMWMWMDGCGELMVMIWVSDREEDVLCSERGRGSAKGCFSSSSSSSSSSSFFLGVEGGHSKETGYEGKDCFLY